ncbi:MAG: hypothetical protein AABY18_08390 [Candidatus Thermoplasmatota archaeon]
MVKTFFAILGLLLVLVGPAAAQEPDPPANGDPAQGDPEPEPSQGDPQPEPSSENETANQQASSTSQSGQSAPQQQAVACRVVATHLADPRVTPTRWVIVDPDGCFRLFIERAVGSPASAIAPRL